MKHEIRNAKYEGSTKFWKIENNEIFAIFEFPSYFGFRASNFCMASLRRMAETVRLQRPVDRQSQRVRRIVGAGDFLQIEHVFEHGLHLQFIRLAVTRDAELQLQRRRFHDLDAVHRGRKEQDAPRLGDVQRGFGIGRKEEFLDDDEVGPPLRQEPVEILTDFHQTFRKREPRSRFDRQPAGILQIPRIAAVDAADADGGQAGVDSKDAHEGIVTDRGRRDVACRTPTTSGIGLFLL